MFASAFAVVVVDSYRQLRQNESSRITSPSTSRLVSLRFASLLPRATTVQHGAAQRNPACSTPAPVSTTGLAQNRVVLRSIESPRCCQLQQREQGPRDVACSASWHDACLFARRRPLLWSLGTYPFLSVPLPGSVHGSGSRVYQDCISWPCFSTQAVPQSTVTTRTLTFTFTLSLLTSPMQDYAPLQYMSTIRLLRLPPQACHPPAGPHQPSQPTTLHCTTPSATHLYHLPDRGHARLTRRLDPLLQRNLSSDVPACVIRRSSLSSAVPSVLVSCTICTRLPPPGAVVAETTQSTNGSS
jgi:hypothetical protein